MSRKMIVHIEAEERADGKTDISLDVRGEATGGVLGTIMLQLGDSFGFDASVWSAIGMAGIAGKRAIGGDAASEICIGGHRFVEE